jgi:FKBP-type peptidyl-prolyl cis-trans isomerase
VTVKEPLAVERAWTMLADDDALIADMEAKMEALRMRLPDLEGKANKRERTAVNKELYALENDESYVDAMKRQVAVSRAKAAADDDAEHAARLQKEKDDELTRAEAADAKRKAAAANPQAGVEDDGEVHMEIERLKNGDGENVPAHGDKVALTYTGTFADGTVFEGADWSGRKFDSTLDHGPQSKKGPKKHTPLAFKLGEGKAIRGWEECVKQMSLGENLKVTIGSKWAYRKAGLTDDNGKVIVPPNASLLFEMRLVQVREKTVEPN